MTNHPNRTPLAHHRARQHLAALGRRYPRAWAQADEFRAGRGRDLPNWADWCFMPLAASYAIVSAEVRQEQVPMGRVPDIARVGALAAWRVSQGIYRFDPDLAAALMATPISGDLPTEVLQRLPEWCVYVEAPADLGAPLPIAGFFAHMEQDANDLRRELRLLLDVDTDTGPQLLPVPIHLGATLAEGLAMMQAESVRMAEMMGNKAQAERLVQGIDQFAASDLIARLVSLLLYLCADEAEIGEGDARPQRPQPKRTRRGWRLFGAEAPTAWPVGVRLGAALRRAAEGGQVGGAPGQVGEAPRATPRAHIRRAHWHSFWTGPKAGPRVIRLKWLPPIAVNVDDTDALPAVVHPVRGD